MARFSKGTLRAHLNERKTASARYYRQHAGRDIDSRDGWAQCKGDPTAIYYYARWDMLASLLEDLENGDLS